MNKPIMKTFATGIALVLALLLSVPMCGLTQVPVSSGQGSSISVVVEMRGAQLIYRVNGKIVTDPLRALGSLYNESTKDSTVEIMVDPHATFLQLGDAEGIVSKAGFSHSRSFVYSHESGMREQIVRNPSERYSPKP
jgi:hypothetical protein